MGEENKLWDLAKVPIEQRASVLRDIVNWPYTLRQRMFTAWQATTGSVVLDPAEAEAVAQHIDYLERVTENIRKLIWDAKKSASDGGAQALLDAIYRTLDELDEQGVGDGR